jgi:carbon monoxide dehydrogenase subunit G
MHVERTFTVPRPIGAVFAYLADFAHTEQWDPGTVSTRRTGGDGGVGTTYANTSEFLGRRVELTYETTTHDPDRELRFRGTNKSATATDWLRLRPVSDQATEIHYRADFEFRGVARLAAPLVVKPKLSALADETVEKLTATLLARTS